MKTTKKTNSIHSFIFPPLQKYCKRTIFITFGSIGIAIWLLAQVITGKISFSQEQLKDCSSLVINVVFVIAALGLALFSLPITKSHTEKEDIVLSYVGDSFYMASIAIFSYVLSYFNIDNIELPRNIYFCVLIIILNYFITRSLATIISYFNYTK